MAAPQRQQPFLGPLVAIGAAVAPSIVEALAGKRAAQVAEAVSGAVTKAAGTSDPGAAQGRIYTDPAASMALRVELARIALEDRQSADLDRQDARGMALANPLVAWAQVMGGLVILGVWSYMVLRIATLGIPAGSVEVFFTVFAGVSGVLGAISQFFYGNSTASSAANSRMDRLASAVAQQVGAPAFQPSQQPATMVATGSGDVIVPSQPSAEAPAPPPRTPQGEMTAEEANRRFGGAQP